jgi:ribosomal protein S6--L-glutamate ligase
MKIGILSNGPKNYATMRIKEVALKRGHEVEIIRYNDCYAVIKHGKPVLMTKDRELVGFDAVMPFIAPRLAKYASAIIRQFENQGVFTMTSSIAVVRASDKLRSTQILAKHKIAMPETAVSLNTADIDSLINNVGGVPVIIKLAHGNQGNGVVLSETKKAARSALQALYMYNSDGASLLVQEYIEESAGTDIRAFVVGGRVVASMKRKSLTDDFRSNIHKGGEGTTIKLTEEERKIAIKATKAIGLNFAGVDLMRSKRGPLVLEVNVSPGFEIEKVTKRDVATPIIEYIERNAKRGQKKDRIGA